MRFAVLLSMIAALLCPIAYADLQPQQARLIPLLQAIDLPAPLRREFVTNNMTPGFIERAGVDSLVDLLADFSDQLGRFEVVSVQAGDHRLIASLYLGDTGDWLDLVLPLGPAPEYKIDGILLAIGEPPAGVVPVATEENLTGVLSEFMNSQGAAGFIGAALVAKGDEVLYAGAFGAADPDAQEHNTMLTPFNVGSLTKIFTAAMIVKLIEEGVLRMDATVGTYLPDWPNQRVRDEVTIGFLITHHSGLGGLEESAYERARGNIRDVAAYAALVSEQIPEFTPGARFHYSDAGYILLGLIAERATGQDYYELMQRHVYGPANMRGAGHFLRSDVMGCCAIGILDDGTGDLELLPMRGSPAGGSYATPVDLWRFTQAFMAGNIVSKEAFEVMTGPVTTLGEGMHFGLGVPVREEGERYYFEHSGSAPGLSVDLTVYPADGYMVIVLSNTRHGARPTASMLRRIIRPLR